MIYRILGKTSLKVSELGLGGAQIGGPSFINNKYIGSPKIETAEAYKILNLAFDNGINFYDTSDCYGDGKSEKYIGDTFSNKRDKLIIATKCGMTSSGERCFEREYILKCCEHSLKRLKTDYIDIYQLKGPSNELIKRGEIFETLDLLKTKGMIRFSGISAVNAVNIDDAFICCESNCIDTIQIMYNLLYTVPEEKLLNLTAKNNIGVICRSPLSSGLLTGKINENTIFDMEDDRKTFMFGELLKQRVDKIKFIKEKFNLTNDGLIEFSIIYLLSNLKISTVIQGVSSTNQLEKNLLILKNKKFDNNEFLKISEFVSSIKTL